jgi:hypothetical protein
MYWSWQRKRSEILLLYPRLSVTLDKLLRLGIKKEQVLFVLLSTFRNFAPYFQKGREEDGLSAERSGHFGVKCQHAPS